MFIENAGPTYYIWGVDQAAYGPVELPGLVSWVKEERVLADTWVYGADTRSWTKASQVPELKMFFRPKSKKIKESIQDEYNSGMLTTGALRRIKMFADKAFYAIEPATLPTLTVRAQALGLIKARACMGRRRPTNT